MDRKELLLLSTPHGALGTKPRGYHVDYTACTFNSTRCIRNIPAAGMGMKLPFLSTPHGALGTDGQIDR